MLSDDNLNSVLVQLSAPGNISYDPQGLDMLFQQSRNIPRRCFRWEMSFAHLSSFGLHDAHYPAWGYHTFLPYQDYAKGRFPFSIPKCNLRQTEYLIQLMHPLQAEQNVACQYSVLTTAKTHPFEVFASLYLLRFTQLCVHVLHLLASGLIFKALLHCDSDCSFLHNNK